MNFTSPAAVIGEHTLGLYYETDGVPMLQILRASAVRGSPHVGQYTIPFNEPDARPATIRDFDDYSVKWHPDYTVFDNDGPRVMEPNFGEAPMFASIFKWNFPASSDKQFEVRKYMAHKNLHTPMESAEFATAEECIKWAKDQGITAIRIGNGSAKFTMPKQ